jgi:hypothetical protein
MLLALLLLVVGCASTSGYEPNRDDPFAVQRDDHMQQRPVSAGVDFLIGKFR